MNLRQLALVGLLGCTPVDPVPTLEPAPDADFVCETTAAVEAPPDGAIDVFPLQFVEWRYSDPDASATIDVVTDSGEIVPGSVRFEDTRGVWTPDLPLAPSTRHGVRTTACDGRATFNAAFTTSTVGPEVPPETLVDATFLVDLTAGEFVEPPGVGALLQQQLEADLLLALGTDDSPDQVELGFTRADDPSEQDLCTPTVPLGTLDASGNPFIRTRPFAGAMLVQGQEFFFEGAELSAGATPAGDLEGIHLSGRVIAQSDVCALLATFGIECSPCEADPSGCFPVEVRRLEGVRHPTPLVTVTPEDIAANPDCP